MGFFKDLGAGLKMQFKSLQLHYLGGYPAMPAGNFPCGLINNDDVIEIHAGATYKTVFSIPKSEIVAVNLDEKGSRSPGKIAAGAVIGGVLSGGIGAVVGGVLGSGKKDKSTIVLTVDHEGIQYNVLFGGDCVKSKYGQFVALIK